MHTPDKIHYILKTFNNVFFLDVSRASSKKTNRQNRTDFQRLFKHSFSGPKSKQPTNVWKMKAILLAGFFACLFLVRSPQNKPKQLYYVAQFPMTSPSKKNYIYIYISIFVQFFCRRFSRDQPSKKINICIYIYIVFLFFCSVFFRRFFRSQPSLPTPKKTYILFIFLSPICPRPALQKI